MSRSSIDRPSLLTTVTVLAVLGCTTGVACSVDSGTLRVTESSATIAAPVCRDSLGAAPRSRREEVCSRWACEARDLASSAWSGDARSCEPGVVATDDAERAVRIVNLHRFLAGVPPVTREPAWTASAQQCALLAHANEKLSHTPPPDWRCWSEVAAHASAVSLIANRSVPRSIGAFIEDPGNEETMGHRRWLLSDDIQRIGVGSTDGYSCVLVDGRGLGGPSGASASEAAADAPGRALHARAAGPEGSRGWVAWPPPGPLPMEAFETERLDAIGWTIQSETTNLDDATVSVTSNGEALPVAVTHLEPNKGSRFAVRFVPDGWATEAGRRYDVRVDGADPIAFTVEPVACE